MDHLVTKDAFRFLGKASFSRIINAFKIWISYVVSKRLHKNLHWGYPISLGIEPTTSCNLRCPECPSGLRSFSRPTGMLSVDLAKKILDEQASTLWYLILYFQGEPYLNPSFFDIVSYASSKKIYISTSTNAHYLDQKNAEKTVTSGLDRLIISIDGLTQESYEKYRIGGQIEKVIAGTKEILSARRRLQSKTPFVIWQFIVFQHNQHEIEEIKKLGKELGVDKVAIKTAQVYDFQDGSELIPTLESYARYKKLQDGSFALKNNLDNHCWKMWSSPVVTWDGRVIPCCFDKDAEHALGQITEHSFTSIWNGPSYRHFRASILRSRKEIDICKNCTEGTKVWA